MSVRKIACLLAILGGAIWVVRPFLSSGDSYVGISGLLHIVGAVPLTVAGLLAGMSLVKKAAPALRYLVALAAPAFGWGVVLYSRELAEPLEVTEPDIDAVFGLLCMIVGLVMYVTTKTPASHRGSHAR